MTDKTLFADKQYPVNIKGCKSFIYPVNSLSLGDNILMTMITRVYLRDNPGEIVSLLPFSYDILEEVKRDRPGKLFLRVPSCVTDDDVDKLKGLTQVFEFELHRECHELWECGESSVFSPQSPVFSPQSMVHSSLSGHWIWDMGQKYVVFHIRNIQKARSKNTDPEFVERIISHLIYNYLKDDLFFVVLVGNDDSYGRDVEYLGYDTVVDLRKKLTLDEIHQVINKSLLYIGSDSGIAHLAGCCGVPMVCWGFMNEFWFPKVRNNSECLFLTKEKSKVEDVLREIRRKLAVSSPQSSVLPEKWPMFH